MRFGPDNIDLIDLVGPYAGEVRPYSRTAGENAIASGWARVPTDGELGLPDAAELELQEAEELKAESSITPLPDDFPARPELIAAGLKTVEAVKAYEDLLSVKGIGSRTVDRIRGYLGGGS